MELRKRLPVIIDFGRRSLNKMNFSKTICLPKQLLKNLDLSEDDEVKIELVQDDDEKFIKLTPVDVDEIEATEDDEDEDEEDDEDEDEEEDE